EEDISVNRELAVAREQLHGAPVVIRRIERVLRPDHAVRGRVARHKEGGRDVPGLVDHVGVHRGLYDVLCRSRVFGESPERFVEIEEAGGDAASLAIRTHGARISEVRLLYGRLERRERSALPAV